MNTKHQPTTEVSLETNRPKNLEKIKFCIISCHKSQLSRNRLLMFTLEK